MFSFEEDLDGLLVKIYRSMEKLEEAMLRASKNLPLSFSEIHAIEAVAKAGGENGATISEISEYLDIRLPSATSVVNKLEQKGFVTKEKCGKDGRVVRAQLTRNGVRAEHAHRYFHRNMMRSLSKDLSEEEKAAVLKGVTKLDSFLDANIAKYPDVR